mmetsp:Transcript_3397/g.8803  ORF Transcript_3397/g.8803 Transcript_3397/m.8803 type:complete len:651 (-) Transcript_3397:39-1991(-)
MAFVRSTSSSSSDLDESERGFPTEHSSVASNDTSDDQASISESGGSSSDGSSSEDVSDNGSLSSHNSDEVSESSSDSEDEGIQVEDEQAKINPNEEKQNISSPMEMELDGAISGNTTLSVAGDHEMMERVNEIGAKSPRNSLSVEDVEDIIKDHNSYDECIGSDSKLCFSEDDEDGTERRNLCKEAKESISISKLLSDVLEIERCNAGIMSAARFLCIQDGDCSKRGPIQLPNSTCESFWIDKMLTTIAPKSEAVKELIMSSSNRSNLSRQIFDVFHSKLSSVNISHVEVPSMKLPRNSMGPNGTSQIYQGKQLVFIGSLRAAECGLALAALRINQVIRIECASPDNLQVIDGMRHSIHILPEDYWESASANETIKNAAEDIISAFQFNPLAPVLVACETGDKFACAACALFLMRYLGIGKMNALDMITEARPSSNVEPAWLDCIPAKDGAHVDLCAHAPLPKRILSSQMLSGLTGVTKFADSPKRQRRKEKNTSACVPSMPSLDLVPSLPYLQRCCTEQADEPVPEGRFECERECERYLSEELNASSASKVNPSTPIPLLTPPASPLVVKSDEGETSICEWPSNLAVDTAMASTMSLSPTSPLCSRQEECKWNDALPPVDYLKTPRSQPIKALATGLTPKLKSIQVSHP